MRRFSPLLFFLFALTASVTQSQTQGSAGDYLRRGVTGYAKEALDEAIDDYDCAIAQRLLSLRSPYGQRS
jgi:hypothetical protein